MSGGSRKGAGRPIGTNRYGEPTKAIRVPISLLPEIEKRLDKMAEAHEEYLDNLDFALDRRNCFVYQLEELNERVSNPLKASSKES